MIIHICDRCMKEMGTYRFHISYSGNNSIDLCEACAKEFTTWLMKVPENKPDTSRLPQYYGEKNSTSNI